MVSVRKAILIAASPCIFASLWLLLDDVVLHALGQEPTCSFSRSWISFVTNATCLRQRQALPALLDHSAPVAYYITIFVLSSAAVLFRVDMHVRHCKVLTACLAGFVAWVLADETSAICLCIAIFAPTTIGWFGKRARPQDDLHEELQQIADGTAGKALGSSSEVGDAAAPKLEIKYLSARSM